MRSGHLHAALGPDFCRNVTLGAFTKLSDLFAKAAAGTPDPGWDFEPDTVNIKKGTILNVFDQGGEPHTFTEVAQFGGGFCRCSMRQVRTQFPNVPAAFQTSQWPRPESFKAANARLRVCRKVNIFLSAASILGCA